MIPIPEKKSREDTIWVDLFCAWPSYLRGPRPRTEVPAGGARRGGDATSGKESPPAETAAKGEERGRN